MLHPDWFRFLVLLVTSCHVVEGANILFVAAVASPSHHIWNRALAFGLVQNGHNVTFIGPDEDNVARPKNYSFILLEGIYDELKENFDINEMANFGTWQMIKGFEAWTLFQCRNYLKTHGLAQLLNYPKDFKFDLIIFDITLGPCFYFLLERFNYPPAIGVSAFLLPPYISYNFGNHLFPAYIPWYNFPYTDEMNFYERVWNFVLTNLDIVLKNNMEYPEGERIGREALGYQIPSWKKLERHISLVLANTDPVLDYPQPLTPNIIPVGGLHTRPAKLLSNELRSIMDNAKNGVILFSLGTNVRSDKLSDDQKLALLEAFSRFNETVVWKYESKIDNLPSNVVVKKWLPQNDLLGHANVKLFVGHGGALSTQEAVYHGVPMVAIPFIFDQYVNSKMIIKRKLGVQMDFRLITTDYVYMKIREVIENPIYRENMKQASRRFQDRLETPLKRGVFWAEYVLRRGGADFLSGASRDMPFYKSSGADVVIFLTIVTAIIIIVPSLLLTIIVKSYSVKAKVKVN